MSDARLKQLRVILAYKNFAARQGVSHIGLGVSAINSAKTLHRRGIRADVLPLANPADIATFLRTVRPDEPPVTHVIISAPWIPTPLIAELCGQFPTITFAIVSHSNVGFLQADTNGIRLIREAISLEAGIHNFHLAGNSRRFCRFIWDAYGAPCKHLPNLYYLDSMIDHNHSRPGWGHIGGVLRIGAFGATRTQKNFLTAIAAGIVISRELKATTEIHVNTARADGPEVSRILGAGQELVRGLPNVRIVPQPWAAWPVFRRVVGDMHLLLQPSYTESFNMITSDGCSQGVPSVISSAITWAPDAWKADVDNVYSIVRTGISLLNDSRAPAEGLRALRAHNKQGLTAWLSYFLREQEVHLL